MQTHGSIYIYFMQTHGSIYIYILCRHIAPFIYIYLMQTHRSIYIYILCRHIAPFIYICLMQTHRSIYIYISYADTSLHLYIYILCRHFSRGACAKAPPGKLHGISKRFLHRLKPMTPPQQTNPDHGSIPQAPRTLQPTPSDDRSIESIVRAADTSPLRSAGVKCRCVPPRVLDVETQRPRGQ